MKQFKGTPGEWSYTDNGVFFDIETETHSIGNVCASLHAFDDSKHVRGGVAEANARLITAAPELLEIVMHVRNCVENDGVYQPANLVHFNNVITKALGE